MKRDPDNGFDDFESHLAILSPVGLDPAWRDEILRSANADSHRSRLAYFFPKPLVAGLAASWILIGALHFINRSDKRQSEIAMPSTPTPAATAAYFESQRQLYAMLSKPNQEFTDE